MFCLMWPILFGFLTRGHCLPSLGGSLASCGLWMDWCRCCHCPASERWRSARTTTRSWGSRRPPPRRTSKWPTASLRCSGTRTRRRACRCPLPCPCYGNLLERRQPLLSCCVEPICLFVFTVHTTFLGTASWLPNFSPPVGPVGSGWWPPSSWSRKVFSVVTKQKCFFVILCWLNASIIPLCRCWRRGSILSIFFRRSKFCISLSPPRQ